MDNNCLFCRIIKKEIPSKIVYEDDFVMAFNDINPQAPVHVLIIPKKHIDSLDKIAREDTELTGKILYAASEIARKLDIAKSGYRTVFNTNSDAGMAVNHLHLHLLGGRKMAWPPG